MKRYLFAIAALSAAIACSKTEIENDGILPEAEGTSTFRISAVISGDAPDPSSKTEFTPPYKVEWSADDRLWVLVRSGEEYSGHCFVKADGDNNWFEEKNSSLVASEITEYNVIYPFDGSLQSIDPDGYTDSPVTVSAGTQSGIGSGAHVDAPLYGKSTGMEIALAHATALYAVTVKNISAEPVSVTNVTLKNELGRNMNGEFHVNPGTGALKAGASVSPEASLSVTDAVIPGNSEGVFYVTSAPVKFGSGESMTVSATANGHVYEVKKTFETEVDFKAGAVYTTSVDVKADPRKEVVFQYNSHDWGAPLLDPERHVDYTAHGTDNFSTVSVYIDGGERITDGGQVNAFISQFRYEVLDEEGEPAEWVRFGAFSNEIQWSYDENVSIRRTATVNVYYDGTSEYVPAGYYDKDNNLVETEAGDPVLTFTVTQESAPKAVTLQYYFIPGDFGGPYNVNRNYVYSVELESAAAVTIGGDSQWGYYGCSLSDQEGYIEKDHILFGNLHDNMIYKAFDENGEEVSWITGSLNGFSGRGRSVNISVSENTSDQPRTAYFRMFYNGGRAYTVATDRYVSPDGHEVITLSDPATEPVYELKITQPGATAE